MKTLSLYSDIFVCCRYLLSPWKHTYCCHGNAPTSGVALHHCCR